MWFERSSSSGLYDRAIDQFMIDVKFYVGEISTYLVDLTLEERLLALCVMILFLIYVIVARARRKYNPGSLGRQFATAVLVLAVVMFGGNIIFGTGAGAYSGIFSI
ncbi:MAG: hypothetical protein AAGJ51_02730 [Pseudomonadota bacterium]